MNRREYESADRVCDDDTAAWTRIQAEHPLDSDYDRNQRQDYKNAAQLPDALLPESDTKVVTNKLVQTLPQTQQYKHGYEERPAGLQPAGQA
ncbi:MAG TPA: hypothetical protein VIY90_18040 [Steroidobacteraceae bacterium]